MCFIWDCGIIDSHILRSFNTFCTLAPRNNRYTPRLHTGMPPLDNIAHDAHNSAPRTNYRSEMKTPLAPNFVHLPSRPPSLPPKLLPSYPMSRTKSQPTMAPGQISRPTRRPNHPHALGPHRYPKHGAMRRPFPKECEALQHQLNMQRQYWFDRTKDRFHQLILLGEGQPSNGTVRRVERPDGETRFAIAYGSAPDDDLHLLLVSSEYHLSCPCL